MWIGTLVSVMGDFVIAFGEGGGLRFQTGVAYLLIAAVLQAIYFIVQKPLLSCYSAMQVTSLAIWTGTLLLLPFLPSLWADLPQAPPRATIAVVYLGMFPTVVGYVAWAYVLSRMPVSSASPFLYIVPVNTILIGWLWLREVPARISLAGGFVTLLGVAITRCRSNAS
jgi:drug/metabolite transporter (DMT)-like permease